MSQLVYSIAEVCEQTTLSRAEVYKRIACGDLEARKIGRRTVVTREALAEYIANLPAVPAALEEVWDHLPHPLEDVWNLCRHFDQKANTGAAKGPAKFERENQL